MKPKEILLNIQPRESEFKLNSDLVGDEHISTSYDTPIRPNAFDKSDLS